MTCNLEDLGACAPVLGKRVTFGAAASIMATLVVASVGLLFSVPSSAADATADKASVERGRDEDLRAMYRFVRELGPKGERTPPAAPPGVAVNTPVIVFEPQMETAAKNSGPASR